jgi:hypothetical protein
MDELSFAPYHNYHCRFWLNDNSTVTGVVFLFSFDNKVAKKYYLVRTNNLIEFRDAQLVGDMNRCKDLATSMPLSNIKKAERI